VETCGVCGAAAKVTVPAHPCAHGICASLHIIACIEDPAVISKILNHLEEKSPLDSGVQIPNPRAPPQAVCLANSVEIYCFPQVVAGNGHWRENGQ
jgi:hypothetical protein